MRRTGTFFLLNLLILLSGPLLLGCSGGGGDDAGSGGATPPPPSTVPGLPARPAADPTHWWNDAVYYEVFVRSFADSATGGKANDGIGDLRGLIERLDYLNDGNPETRTDLGVNALWLMPIMQSPSYHGYDVTDYLQIESDYGNNADFQALITAAHARGIKVIVDLVLNHASSQHPRFLAAKDPASSYRDWFVWSPTNPGYLGPWGQPVWHRSGDAYFYGVFWSGMPDWNFRQPAVTSYMRDVTRFWLETMNVDGFRLDAIRHLVENGSVQTDTAETHQWLKDYIAFYKTIKPQAMTVGEVWTTSDIVATYAGEMDMTFQFDLAGAILDAANNANGGRLESELSRVWSNFQPSQFATFITNHDQNRVMTELGGDTTKAKLAATLLLTMPGVPFIYYGEEIGMTGAKPDELIRTPLQWSAANHAGFSTVSPWEPPNNDFPQVNIAAQSAQSDSLLSHYRKLVHARREHPALAKGDLNVVNTSANNLVAYLRQSAGQSILVILNLSSGPVSDYSIPLNANYDQAQELLSGATLQKGSVVTVNGVTGYRPIATLAPRSGYVIRLP